MDDSSSSRGYALTGLMCIGSLACGPEQPAEDGGTTSSTTGFPMTGTESGTDESGSSDDTDTDTDTDPDTGTDTGPQGCDYQGTICGEFSICQCSCDYSADCCSCEPALCTEDGHCAEGEICFIDNEYQGPATALCIPEFCEQAAYIQLNGADADPSEFADAVCAVELVVESTNLVDLQALATLQFAITDLRIRYNPLLTSLAGPSLTHAGDLQISYNDGLTDISALASLESVGDVLVFCNAQLQTADIEAIFDQIPDKGMVEIVSNGEGPC